MTGSNGNRTGTPLELAVRAEEEIAATATELRGEAVGLDADLFLKLWPLLRKPFHAGFIQTIGVVKGKPYASTGVRSVQVQIDRMNNVLTPLGWRDEVEYLSDGRVARVRVEVVSRDGAVLCWRESWGGVNQASTEGNLHKGSYTNAAKLAFARLGPGHEVYIGATDLDPDVHEDTAKQQTPRGQAAAPPPASDRLLTDDERLRLVEAFAGAGITDMTMHLTAAGIDSTDDVTVAAAFKLRELLDQHIAAQVRA